MSFLCGHKKGSCRTTEHQSEGEASRCAKCCPSCASSSRTKRPRLRRETSDRDSAADGDPSTSDLQAETDRVPRRVQRDAAALSRQRVGAMISNDANDTNDEDPLEGPQDETVAYRSPPSKVGLAHALQWDKSVLGHLPRTMLEWEEQNSDNHTQWKRVSLIIARSVETITRALCPSAVDNMVQDVGKRLTATHRKADESFAMKFLSLLAELSDKVAPKSIEKRVLNVLIHKSMKDRFARDVAPRMISRAPENPEPNQPRGAPPVQLPRPSMIGMKRPRSGICMPFTPSTELLPEESLACMKDHRGKGSTVEASAELVSTQVEQRDARNSQEIASLPPINLVCKSSEASTKQPPKPFLLTQTAKARAKEDYVQLIEAGHLKTSSSIPVVNVVRSSPSMQPSKRATEEPVSDADIVTFGPTLAIEQKVSLRIKVLDAQTELKELLSDVDAGNPERCKQRLQTIRKLMQNFAKELP